ncbi:hypothetical protein NFI96_017475 [Prochilodus magdalenae]|nr:hypothetical protein NFI96_017475 [Prochilodus magdalenae]
MTSPHNNNTSSTDSSSSHRPALWRGRGAARCFGHGRSGGACTGEQELRHRARGCRERAAYWRRRCPSAGGLEETVQDHLAVRGHQRCVLIFPSVCVWFGECYAFHSMFVSLSPFRVVCLLGLCLAFLMLVQLLRDVVLPKSRGVDHCLIHLTTPFQFMAEYDRQGTNVDHMWFLCFCGMEYHVVAEDDQPFPAAIFLSQKMTPANAFTSHRGSCGDHTSLKPSHPLCSVLGKLSSLALTLIYHSYQPPSGRWEMVDSGQEGRSEAEAQFTDSWISFKLFLAETSSFKKQNPGKFCLLVCSLCSFLAVLGRYIPGIVISYIIVLGIFLWPLVSSHEFGLWLDPVLQKLDFGVREFLQKIKENHEKRLLQAQTEKESIEADLSSLFPKLDSTACRELSVSDTEVSEVTWTDNGTFNLSEGHTPQTENSEDLDRRSEEEVFSGGLPDFPSLDNGLGTNGDDDDDLSIGLPALLLQPSHQQGACVEGEAAAQALGLVQRMAGDVITAAVTAAMQERLEAVGAPVLAQALAEDTDSEAEDFELLDQSELEQLEGELGLEKPSGESQPKGTKQQGFFSKLLGHH